jgi:hypothetical protein
MICHRYLFSATALSLLGGLFLSGCDKASYITYREGKAMSDTRQIGIGLRGYMQDYKDMRPLLGEPDAGLIKADEVLPVLTL